MPIQTTRALTMVHRPGPVAVPRRRVPPAARSPRIIPLSPKVATLMGLGDYSVITPGGARITYGGNDPNAGGGTTTPPVANPSPYEGMFIQDQSLYGVGQIYLVQNGQKHWVPDQTTLKALGGWPGKQTLLPTVIIDSIPTGAPMPSIQLQTSTVAQPVSPAGTGGATPTPSTSTTPVYSSTLESGAVYNAATGTYTNPDGTIYQPAATSNYISTAPSYSSVLEPGAVYNASTGYYTNPDGTIYAPATSTSTFSLSTPSTWPTWVWLALAAGGTWLLFLKRR